jgi:hypothetical protein
MPIQPFSPADPREAIDALYGRRQWQLALARDLNTTPRAVKGWFNGKPLPDLREKLADLCRLAAVDNPDNAPGSTGNGVGRWICPVEIYPGRSLLNIGTLFAHARD